MIKKIILILLICGILATCLASCKNTGGTQAGNGSSDPAGGDSKPKLEETNEEILKLFSDMRAESEKVSKMSFNIKYQEEHFSFLESGEYADKDWFSPSVVITVVCDYSLATDSEWYVDGEGTKALNQAFYEYSCDGVDGKYFSLLTNVEALHFVYQHGEDVSAVFSDFYADYEIISSLTSYEYVKSIKIVYFYGVPYDFSEA